MLSSIITTEITAINAVIAISGMSALVWSVSKTFPQLIAKFQEESLSKSLSRQSSDQSEQPLFKVFYHFNHASTAAWVNWLKTQEAGIQEKALQQLINHLEADPDEWGAVTLEVVKALIEYGGEDSFDIIQNLIDNTAACWPQYIGLTQLYPITAEGLIKLNPVRGSKYLVEKLNTIKHLEKYDEMRAAIVNAFLLLDKDSNITEILSNIITNEELDLTVRTHALKVSIKREDTELRVIYSAILQYLPKSQNDDKIASILKQLLTQIDLSDEEYWGLFFESLKSEEVLTRIHSTLCQEISNPVKAFSKEQLFSIYNLKSPFTVMFQKAMAERFALNEKELAIINESPNYDFEKESVKIIDQLNNFKLIKSLQSVYNKISSTAETIQQKIILVAAAGENDKFLSTLALAQKMKQKLIYLDVNKLLLSPDKVKQIEKIILHNAPAVVFLNDMHKLISENDTNPRAKDFLHILTKLHVKPNVKFIACLNSSMQNIRADASLSKGLTSLPAKSFSSLIEITECNTNERQKIWDSYSIELSSTRGAEIINFCSSLDSPETLSYQEFTGKLLKYIKTSILISGKLIDLEEYKNLYR